MSAYALIVFDMAGTTVNEDNVVYKTIHEAFAEAGYEIKLEDVLRLGAGKEKLNAIRDILKHLPPETDYQDVTAAAIHADFRQRLKVAYQDLQVSSFPGSEAFLARLRKAGIKIALNTGYDRPTAEQLLQKMNWQAGHIYDVLVTADDVDNSRPAPDMILLAMNRTQVTSSAEVVKVGDSVIDIEEGKNAACGLTIGVTTGAQSRVQLTTADPDAIVDQLSEISALVGL